MGRHDDTNDGGTHLPAIVEQPCGLYTGLEAFSSDYGAGDYSDWVEQSNGDPVPAPIVLYLQDAYPLDQLEQARAIEQELRAQGALFDSDRPLEQIIFTGSIAAEWSENQLYRLVSAIQASFLVNQNSLNNWCACVGSAIPSEERLRLLRILGFSYIRFTLADPAPALAQVDSLVAAARQARRLGFNKIILDMRQVSAEPPPVDVLESLVEQAGPDRIRMPHSGGNDQGSFDGVLASRGYRNMGLDWYLHENDSWWQARKANRLYWTLLGYSELHNPDVIGIGPAAVSSVGDCYAINAASPSVYAATLEQGGLPIVRGVELEPADLLRREIVAMILTASCIRVAWLEEKWGIQFDTSFAREKEQLQALERHKLVTGKTGRIDINARGYRELSEICNIFKSRASRQRGADAQAPSSNSTSASKSHVVS